MLRRLLTALAVGVALVGAAPAGAHAGVGYFTSRDVTARDRAPAGNDQPAGWTTTWDLARHFAYRSDDGRIIVASAPAGSKTWTWVSASTEAQLTDTPWGYLSAYSYYADQSSHIIFSDGVSHHLHELWTSRSSPGWHHADLTAGTGAPMAFPSPRGYEKGGQQHITFESWEQDHSLWELTFAPGSGWGARSLGIHTCGGFCAGQASTAIAADRSVLAYVGDDAHLHVRISAGGEDETWGNWADGPPADVSFYHLTIDHSSQGSTLMRLSVRYLAPDGHLHAYGYDPANGFRDQDVSSATGHSSTAPQLPNSSFGVAANFSDHLFTVEAGNSVHEYIHTAADRWYHWVDFGPSSGYAGGFAAPDTVLPNGSQTEYVAYFHGTTHHLIINDLTVRV